MQQKRMLFLDNVNQSKQVLQDIGLEKNKLKQISDQLDILPARRWMVWGEPQQEITQFAAQKQIDLIVVGSHGRHGLTVLMGSTAKGVLYQADCDVLAIHLKDH